MKPTQMQIQNALRILTKVFKRGETLCFYGGDIVGIAQNTTDSSMDRTQELAAILHTR